MLIKLSRRILQPAQACSVLLSIYILLCMTGVAYADAYKPQTEVKTREQIAGESGLTLVASIRPLAFLLNELALPADEVIQLVSNNSSAHHYQLKVSDRRLLQSADLVVWVGPALELFLEKPLKQVARAGGESIVTLNDTPGLIWFDSRAESTTKSTTKSTTNSHVSHSDNNHDNHSNDDHLSHSDNNHDNHENDNHANHSSDDHANHSDSDHDNHSKDAHDKRQPQHTDHGHDHDQVNHAQTSASNNQHERTKNTHDDHQHDGRDPHIWLNPINVQAMVGLLAARLSKLSPENATAYQQKAQTLIEGLSTLDQNITQQMAGITDKPFTVLHPAYSHFINRYQLKQLNYVVINPESAIGAKHLYELSQQKMVCVFGEVGQGNQHIETIAVSASARVGELDPLGSNLADGASIIELIQSLADDFKACLV